VLAQYDEVLLEIAGCRANPDLSKSLTLGSPVSQLASPRYLVARVFESVYEGGDDWKRLSQDGQEVCSSVILPKATTSWEIPSGVKDGVAIEKAAGDSAS